MNSKEPITVAQARAIIAANVNPVPPAFYYIENTAGLTLAEDVYAPVSLPAFDQSSMDGYAIRFDEISETLTVQGESQAGAVSVMELQNHHAIRIFTGAPLPPGADTVIMQEKVFDAPDGLRIESGTTQRGANTRRAGAELKKGELILENGTKISPAITGLLASMGITGVLVFPPPSVCIIATGKELRKPGEFLQFGEVYESNAFFLNAALRKLCIGNIRIFYAPDDLSVIKDYLHNALNQADVILFTGGISIGNYDFVRQAADENGVQCRFHRVRQKPGKPFYFGTKQNKPVFALPGNPGSVITCFYEYILPALKHMMQQTAPEATTGILKESYHKVPGLTQFLKGYIEDGVVEILEAQESFRLRSFASANCLVNLDEDRTEYDEGEVVQINMIPD